MKVASAFACAALVLYPAVGSAEIKASIQPPPGWTKRGMRPPVHTWYRGEQFVDLDTQSNTTPRRTLRAYVHDIVEPASNTHGARLIASGPTTACAGRQQAWLLTISLEPAPGTRGLLEVVVAVSGAHVYEAAYMRPSTEPPRAEAERAIRSLCLNRI